MEGLITRQELWSHIHHHPHRFSLPYLTGSIERLKGEGGNARLPWGPGTRGGVEKGPIFFFFLKHENTSYFWFFQKKSWWVLNSSVRERRAVPRPATLPWRSSAQIRISPWRLHATGHFARARRSGHSDRLPLSRGKEGPTVKSLRSSPALTSCRPAVPRTGPKVRRFYAFFICGASLESGGNRTAVFPIQSRGNIQGRPQAAFRNELVGGTGKVTLREEVACVANAGDKAEVAGSIPVLVFGVSSIILLRRPKGKQRLMVGPGRMQ